MAKIEIYTSPFCGYCRMAKRLLRSKRLDYTEYDVMYDSERMDEMLGRSGGRRTVPQIFIDSVGIGGYDELHRLSTSNRLDELLNNRHG